MKKVIRLTESDLIRIVKRVIKEHDDEKFEGYETLINYFGHCKGSEKPCYYNKEETPIEFEILDNDMDVDSKLKRIGLKLGVGHNFYTVRDLEDWRKRSEGLI